MTTKTAAPATTPIDCLGCGRTIVSARSLRAANRNGGYGRGCARKVADRAKAAAQSEPATRLDAATEAIEDGAVVHQTRDLWLVVSSKGDEVYTVDVATGGCTCPAGEHGRSCWHQLAVELLTGVPVTVPAKVVELATPADPFACIPADAHPFANAA